MQETSKVDLPGTWTVEDVNEFLDLLSELLYRDRDSLFLYKPLPTAEKFHRCMAHEVGLSGSNRAGKTNAASAEVAMVATGSHVVEGKYPKKDLQIACIGNDERHLSLMYQYLFDKAPFDIFLHPETMQWTVVIPDNPDHRKYMHLWEEASPMIHPRLVKYVSWANRKEQIPRSVRLHNGTVIRFYSGLVRRMPQGRKFHLAWIDEEIENPGRWVDELRARIVDFNGYLLWSATPQHATVEFDDMRIAAENPENADKPLEEQTGFFVMLSSDNFYLSERGNAAFLAKLKDNDEQLQTRYYGKSARNFLVVYPGFGDHNLIPKFVPRWEDTRYIIIDPGVSTAGIIFACCPQLDPNCSPEERPYRTRDGCIIIYDELKIHNANQQLVALAIKEKLDQHPRGWIQDFTIDKHGGRSLQWKDKPQHQTCEELYYEAILARDIKPRVEGWQYGTSKVDYGVNKTIDYIAPNVNDHLPYLFVVRDCKKTIWEFKAWKKKRGANGEFIGYEEKNNHLLDCIRYATTREIGWVPPPQAHGPKPFTLKDVKNQHKDLLKVIR